MIFEKSGGNSLSVQLGLCAFTAWFDPWSSTKILKAAPK